MPEHPSHVEPPLRVKSRARIILGTTSCDTAAGMIPSRTGARASGSPRHVLDEMSWVSAFSARRRA